MHHCVIDFKHIDGLVLEHTVSVAVVRKVVTVWIFKIVAESNIKVPRLLRVSNFFTFIHGDVIDAVPTLQLLGFFSM